MTNLTYFGLILADLVSRHNEETHSETFCKREIDSFFLQNVIHSAYKIVEHVDSAFNMQNVKYSVTENCRKFRFCFRHKCRTYIQQMLNAVDLQMDKCRTYVHSAK